MSNSLLAIFMGIAYGALFVSAPALQASVDLPTPAPTHDTSNRRSKLDAEEIYQRTEIVLSHFGVASESDSQPLFDDLENSTRPSDAQAILKYLDPHGYFPQFSGQTNESSPRLDVYQDRSSKRALDYSVELNTAGTGQYRSADAFYDHLIRASTHAPASALAGLRIALDPGHMGGPEWDKRTGKYVIDSQTGHKISEGVMNLQIALLLEKDFQSLGAEVMITHRGLAPVSDLPYDTFDLKPYGLRELREHSLDSWFQALLETASGGPALFDAFSKSGQFKKLFSEFERSNDFIIDADLDARVEKIKAFHPDITLIIHLDTNDTPGKAFDIDRKDHYDATKAYVPGGVQLDEMSSREDRKLLGRHLLDTRAWNASVALSHSIVGHIHSALGVPFDHGNDDNAVEIEPGVLARNLVVQRGLYAQASSYVECLFYTNPDEFNALYKTTHPLQIEGEDHPYSDRLGEIEKSLRDAVVAFVQNYKP
jgi:N-acetylmuramoyl-L-alanine amidase